MHAFVPVLVRLSECKDDVLELIHYVLRGMVHELERTLIVWLGEVMILRKSDDCQYR